MDREVWTVRVDVDGGARRYDLAGAAADLQRLVELVARSPGVRQVVLLHECEYLGEIVVPEEVA